MRLAARFTNEALLTLQEGILNSPVSMKFSNTISIGLSMDHLKCICLPFLFSDFRFCFCVRLMAI